MDIAKRIPIALVARNAGDDFCLFGYPLRGFGLE